MKEVLHLFKRNQYYKDFKTGKSLNEQETRTLDKSFNVKSQNEIASLVKRHIHKFIVFWDHPRTVKKLILLF